MRMPSLRLGLVVTLLSIAASCRDCTPIAEGEGEGEGEGEPAVVERVVCQGAPTATPGADVCSVTPGAGGLVVIGDLLLPGQIFEGGGVSIDEDGTISCVGCDCAATGASRTLVVCPDAVVSPAFINAHDHAGWMNEAPWVAADNGVDPSLRWEQRHDWRRGKRGHPEINAEGQANTDAKALGELRFALGGATATLASGGFSSSSGGVLRNLDDSDDTGPLGIGFVDYETFPLDDSNGTQLATGCAYGDILSAPTTAPYAPHISEGIDVESRNEFLCLSSTANGGKDVLSDKTAVIHGVGLLPADIALMAERNASLIWSPRSNVSLYGDTAQIPLFLRLGVNVALGTDWIPSGSMNVLRELRCALDLNESNWGSSISDETLWRMATVNAAQALGAGSALGTLAVGHRGDLAIIAKVGRADFRAAIAATTAEVALVLKDGLPLTGNAAVVDALETGCDALDVCGTAKKVCVLRETGKALAALQAGQNGAGYDLFSCEQAPANEPSCVPARVLATDVVDNSTQYSGDASGNDEDGDGIVTGDNCPTLFNPARPLDDGAQGDVDGDGAGDLCDPCPFDADTEACETFSNDDGDGDGLDNLADNCPSDANPGQENADSDDKGDACDSCPATANNGDAGCPLSVYDIKTASVDALGAFGRVSVPDLIVTGVQSNGFYAQANPASSGYPGVDNSCIFTFFPGDNKPAIGDVIDITGAVPSSFFTQTQLSGTVTFTVVATGTPLTGEVVAGAVIAENAALGARSPLEACLVRVEDVTVTDATPTPGAGDPTALNELEIDDTATAGAATAPPRLRVDDAIFLLSPLPGEGEQLAFVRGPMAFKNGLLKVLPRTNDDVAFGATGLAALEPALSFLRTDSASAVTFPDSLEVRLTSAATEATAVLLSSSEATVTVPASVTIAVGALTAVVPVTSGATELTATITARLLAGDAGVTSQVRVLAPDAPAVVVAIDPVAASLSFGAAQVFTVTLDVPAPVDGTSASITLNPTNLGNVTSPVALVANATSATFTFTAGTAAASGSVTVGNASADVTVVDPSSLTLDLSGFRLVQTDSSATVIVPDSTSVPVGGFLIVGRNIDETGFELFYGALPANAVYLNGKTLSGGSANGFPVINGEETMALLDASGTVLDGPTIVIESGTGYQRTAPAGDSSAAGSWTEAGVAPGAGATPGTAPAGTHGGCYISEIVDAAAFANEYIEIHCDSTTP